MMANIFTTPTEAAEQLAKLFKDKRLQLNWTQHNLATRSGVSLATLKKFEQTASISLQSFLNLALTLGLLPDFTELFKEDPFKTAKTIDDLFKNKPRKRGRK